MDFSEKWFLITGASMGLGEQFAAQLAEKGANLILTARSKDKLNALADELRQSHAVEVQVIPMDLARPGAAHNLVLQIAEWKIPVYGLINNAGFGKWGPFEAFSAEIYQEMIDLNVSSLVMLTRLLLPGMLEKQEGVIVNVSSVVGFVPVAYFTVYAATKAFVLNFTESLWAEVKDRGVRVLALCPGSTKTNFQVVAGTDESTNLKMDDPGKVVEICLRHLEKNKSSVVTGLHNVLFARGTRPLSRKFIASMTAKLFSPGSGKEKREKE